MQTIRKSNRAGFSLVETLIGVSILSVSMLAAFTAQVAARNLMRESNETELARGILESTMERLLTEDAEELATGVNYMPGQNIEVTETQLLKDAQILFSTPGFTVGDPTPDLLSIRLDLTWTGEGGGEREFSMVSAVR